MINKKEKINAINKERSGINSKTNFFLKFIVFIVIAIMIFNLLYCNLYKSLAYIVKINGNVPQLDNYNGVIIANNKHNYFTLNLFFNKPLDKSVVGLYYYENEEYKIINASTISKLVYDSTLFPKAHIILQYDELSNDHEDSIMNKILKNKEQLFLCISYNDNNIDKLPTGENCYKLDFVK